LCWNVSITYVFTKELMNSFLVNNLMDALGVCYLQYWLQDDVEQNFQHHFMLIKRHYCPESKLWRNFAMSPLILSFKTMNLQQSIFKCTIKVNVVTTMEPPFHVNSFIWLWWTLFIFYFVIRVFKCKTFCQFKFVNS